MTVHRRRDEVLVIIRLCRESSPSVYFLLQDKLGCLFEIHDHQCKHAPARARGNVESWDCTRQPPETFCCRPFRGSCAPTRGECLLARGTIRRSSFGVRRFRGQLALIIKKFAYSSDFSHPTEPRIEGGLNGLSEHRRIAAHSDQHLTNKQILSKSIELASVSVKTISGE